MKLKQMSKVALGTTLFASAILLVACGSEATEIPPTEPTVVPRATSDNSPQPTSTPTIRPTGEVSSPTPTATLVPQAAQASLFDAGRQIGDIEGITFLVSEGSEATFTVKEKLARLPLPSDAVVRTTAITGEVYLDGRPWVIEIDLLQLGSDQSLRDGYIRRRMFPNDSIALFTVEHVGQIPQSFLNGEVTTGTITGQFEIRGVKVPITFELEARDDGDVIFILGRSSFVWADFEMRAPNLAGIVQVEDEVAVEILLAVRPVLAARQ